MNIGNKRSYSFFQNDEFPEEFPMKKKCLDDDHMEMNNHSNHHSDHNDSDDMQTDAHIPHVETPHNNHHHHHHDGDDNFNAANNNKANVENYENVVDHDVANTDCNNATNGATVGNSVEDQTTNHQHVSKSTRYSWKPHAEPNYYKCQIFFF